MFRATTILLFALVVYPGLFLVAEQAVATPISHLSRRPAHLHKRGRAAMSGKPSTQVHYRSNEPARPRLPRQVRSRMIVKKRDDASARKEHDDYETQQHKLEQALDHYIQYGDTESLTAYLGGFGNVDVTPLPSSGSGSTEGSPSGSTGGKQKDCEDGQQKPADNSQLWEQPAPASNPAPAPAPEPEPASNTDTPKTGSEEKPQSDEHEHQQEHHHHHHHHEQPHQNEGSSTNDQPASTPSPSPAPSPSPSDESDDSNSGSIWGYSPPAFKLAGPSISTLQSSAPFTGQATWYNTGLGACGETNDDSHPIVAVSKDIFEQYNPSSGNPNENSLCGKKIEIDWQGKKQLVFAMDECPSCAPSSLDLSPAVFKSLDDPDKGLLKGIQWKFV